MLSPAALAASLCLLSFLTQAHGQLRIMTPDSLKDQFKSTRGKIQGSTATFGAPFYGDRVLGRVVWGDSKKGNQHCADDDYDIPDQRIVAAEVQGEASEYSSRLINIVMVRRGKCSFVTKVRVAAKKGAHAVIIVDAKDSKLTTADLQKIIVADDGYGATIHVPSVLISKEDGERLILAAKADKESGQVVVQLAWDVPTNNVVNIDLWMSAASSQSTSFMKAFAPKRKALNKVVKFTPHFAIFSMESAKPGESAHDYNNLCLDGNAEICAEDPDAGGSVTGRDVLNEDTRQLCIHELTKVKSLGPEGQSGIVEYAEKFWDYIEAFPDRCPLEGTDENTRFGDVCSQLVMKEKLIDVDAVTLCVRTTQTDKLKEQREHRAWSPRALRINGWRYSGALDANLVTRAICAGFVKQPTECAALVAPRNFKKPDDYKKNSEASTVSVGAFVTTTIIISLLMFAALLLYKRTLKSQMNRSIRDEVMLEVQSQMGAYQKMAQNF